IIEEAYFDGMQKTLHIKGYHKIKWQRDSQGNIAKEMYFDKEDNSSVGDMGCYSLVLEYNKRGNPITESCLGHDQKLIANKTGWAVCRRRFDSQGRLIEVSFYDDLKRPV